MEKEKEQPTPLAKLRTDASLTQMQLADAVGTAPARVSDWELGRRKPSIKFLRRIAAACGVTVDRLVTVIEDTEREVEREEKDHGAKRPRAKAS